MLENWKFGNEKMLYHWATQTSRPGFKLCIDDELVGIETILGMKA